MSLRLLKQKPPSYDSHCPLQTHINNGRLEKANNRALRCPRHVFPSLRQRTKKAFQREGVLAHVVERGRKLLPTRSRKRVKKFFFGKMDRSAVAPYISFVSATQSHSKPPFLLRVLVQKATQPMYHRANAWTVGPHVYRLVNVAEKYAEKRSPRIIRFFKLGFLCTFLRFFSSLILLCNGGWLGEGWCPQNIFGSGDRKWWQHSKRVEWCVHAVSCKMNTKSYL